MRFSIKKKLFFVFYFSLLGFANFAILHGQENSAETGTTEEKPVKDDIAEFIAKLSLDEALTELNDAIRMGDLARTEKILNVFPDLLNRKDNFGATPLFNACHAEKIEIVSFLLEKKADLNLPNIYGDQPIHCAAQTGNCEILELLFKHGAVFWAKNKKGETPIFKAVAKGKQKAVQLLLEKGEIVNNVDLQGNTPLHKAALTGNIEMVKFLVSKGAKVNAKNNANKKPAELATNEKIKKLLESLDPEIPKEEHENKK